MLNPDFRDILSSLNEAGAEFLVVGAYALSAYGLVRATGDIDIFLNNSTQNAARVMAALRAFGAPLSDITMSDLSSEDTTIQFGVEPFRIDLLTKISGVAFPEAWANRVEHEVEGVKFYVPSMADLLTNKRASGRGKDLSDISWLESKLN